MSIYNAIGWLAMLGMVWGGSLLFHRPSPSPLTPSPISSPVSVSSSSRYHKITVTLTSLDDLKIKVGDRIQKEMMISDRPLERLELVSQEKEITTKIHQLSLPLPLIPSPSLPDFASEEIALRQAELKLAQITEKLNAGAKLQFKQPELSQIFESDAVEQYQRLQEQEHQARLEIESAIARLNEAKSRAREQQYEHNLRLADYQTRLQRQQHELALLHDQLKTLKEQQKNIVV